MDGADWPAQGIENHLRPFLVRRRETWAPPRQAQHIGQAARRGAGGIGLRTWARVLSAVAFLVAGLAETLGATGLVILVSPDARWGPGTHTLALGGLLQMAAAALLASGRKTRWALGILLGYVSLGSIFGNLPQVFDAKAGGSALAALAANLAVVGGLVYWLHLERTPDWRALPPQDLTAEGLAASRSRQPSQGAGIQPASDVRREAAG